MTFTGELIEQNQDGLEYSSEEETEDIKDAAANLASKQRKELAKVDHASLQYMPFRKAFYTEVNKKRIVIISFNIFFERLARNN